MTSPSTSATYGKQELQAIADAVAFWWHSIDLGQGVVTKGEKSAAYLARELASLRLPPLRDKTVLDIGAWDGFYSFEAEKRGARRVVSLDHFVWSTDLPSQQAYERDCKHRGVVPLPIRQTPYWQPDKLPGKRGYDSAHQALHSRAEAVVDDFMTMDSAPLGTFDVVFFLGVLYHMEEPLASLRRVASLTKEVAIIETHAVALPGYEHLELSEFYSSNQLNGDVTNWWGPNLKALQGMCLAAGFKRVDVVKGPRTHLPTAIRNTARKLTLQRQNPRHYRAVVHAWK